MAPPFGAALLTSPMDLQGKHFTLRWVPQGAWTRVDKPDEDCRLLPDCPRLHMVATSAKGAMAIVKALKDEPGTKASHVLTEPSERAHEVFTYPPSLSRLAVRLFFVDDAAAKRILAEWDARANHVEETNWLSDRSKQQTE